MNGVARFDLAKQILTHDEKREIATQLLAGALIIYPTDTLYAIGCLAFNPAALERLRAAKGREGDKPLPVIAADLLQARALTSSWPAAAQKLADVFWPGPLTLILPAAPDLPPQLLAGSTGVAVRVPASGPARLLAGLAGPLVSTSANLAGQAPCTTVEAAVATFPSVDLIFDVGLLDGAPSTIVEIEGPTTARWKLIREGAIAREKIEVEFGTLSP
ncbi:MAG: L-threonylcarbamoyladenylate synthase [Vicinamibacteria bacterium]